MFSNIFRIIETRSFKPLKFTKINAEYIDNDVEDIGIYIHIPFCKKLCSFCPYNKVKYDEALSLRFKDALLKEIHLIGDYYKKRNITSIYFGGGTPSLMIEELNDIIITLKEVFNINCDIGIELHPSDITKDFS